MEAFRRLGHRLGLEVGRRPAHALLAGLVLGLLLARAPVEVVALPAALVTLGLAALGRPALGLLAGAIVAAGAAGGALRVESLDAAAGLARPGSSLDALAVLLEAPRPGRFGASATIEITSGPARGTHVLARGSNDARWPPAAGPGLELAVSGDVKAPRARPGADFDWPAYLRRRGIGAELRLDRLRATGGRRGGVLGAVDAMRRRAERGLEAGVTPAHAALLRGMVLGQDEQIAPAVRDDFRLSGLAHLLAVSGQNVMLLGALALPLLGAAGLGPRGRIAGLLVLIALYVPLAGAGPSLQRAGVMGAAGLVALAAERPASRLYAVLLAAAVTLGFNPRVAEDPGWQLSFAAVGGILVLAPRLRRPLAALPEPLAEGLAVTVAATVATAPLLAHHFDTVSAAALPANVLALPAVAPVMWIGMLGAAIGQLSALGPVGEALAGGLGVALGRVNEIPLGFVEGVASTFATFPGADLRFELEHPAAVAGAYAALALGVVAVSRVARAAEPYASTVAAEWRRLPSPRRAAVVAGGLGGAAALLMLALGPGGPPDRLTVSFLDVGQGDAVLVRDPTGAAVLFDTGPPEARTARLVRSTGVRRLSMLVATHASRDHHGGMAEVLREIPTDLLLDGGDGTSDPSFTAAVTEGTRRGTRRVPARAGQALRVGTLAIRVLSPPPRPSGPAPEDPNPRAVVAVLSAGEFDLFLSGDAESPSLVGLPLGDVDAMKVPHHGSKDPGLPSVLDRLGPEIAVAQVGEGNGYGHPAPETMGALERAGARVQRTDRDGTVTLEVGSEAVEVDTER